MARLGVEPPGGDAPPVQAGKTLQGTVKDGSGVPLAGAWVVAADVLDSNGDNSYFAVSTRTDSQGNYSLTVEGSDDWLWLSATAAGTRTWTRQVRTAAGSNVRDIILEPCPDDTVLFWGKLTGGDVSGTRIATSNTMPDPLTVTNAQGLFCACIRKNELVSFSAWNLKGNTSFPVKESQSRTMASAFSHSMLTQGFSTIQGTVLLAEVGGPVAAPGGTKVAGWARDAIGNTISTIAAQCSDGGSGSFVTQQEFPVGAACKLVAWDGHGRWGVADISSANQAATIVMSSATAALNVHVLGQSVNSAGAPGGSVELFLLLDWGTESLEKRIAEMSTGTSAQVTFNVPPGEYRAFFRNNRGAQFASPRIKVLPDDTRVDVELAAGQSVPDHLINRTIGMTNPGTIHGSIVTNGFSLLRLAVFLVDPRTGTVKSDATVSLSSGTYTFEDIPPGTYEVTALGETTTGKRAFQADGPERVVLEDGASVDRTLHIHTAKCIVVGCYRVARLNPRNPREITPVGAVPDATVELLDGTGQVVETKTATNGICIFEHLADQVYQIRVTRSGYNFPARLLSIDMSTVSEKQIVRAFGEAVQ